MQEKMNKRHLDIKKEVKLPLFPNYAIVYVEHLMNSTKNKKDYK